MNSNLESNNKKTIDATVNNMYLLMKQLNSTVVIDEKLKSRTRNGGFIARPQNRSFSNLQERNNA